ncbi:exodeoxyribonuclease V subunit gamma [Synechococcus sp. MU1611]|uniref:exodeoxyribonuclease V subunit gamma n=1 Tax=Synechococcus sp. MU1611 TaxID=2508345 RepID=UPI001CF81869|nr:exodeoxyribonuclease V subunit gamma [Synechococcus sp. MU1611]MCB4410596.1 exonuclease V subunit gamma [Synechococcus sp. MU1611]
MLTVYRSNRAEFLARLLSRQLIEQQLGPLETVEVMVNTWPTSRWLGEQLAMANGISSLVRFPFPGSRLRQLVRQVLHLPAQEDDPWRAGQLVWAVLELLPELLEQPVAQPLQVWLAQREGTTSGLTRDRWQLARSIADAMDDYALYRPDQLERWKRPRPEDDWQAVLWRLLAQRLPRAPFGLQVREAVDSLRRGDVDPAVLPERLRLFGISALAPVQVDLIQALSGLLEVEIYLLTPCPDLWQRCGSRRASLGEDWLSPPDGGWLAEAPRLEAVLGRMGAEFQQLLEGSGEAQLGERREGDLFAGSLQIAAAEERQPTLLDQLQQQLVDAESISELTRSTDDQSLLFQAAPGPWREVQLVRDRILQWLAADPDLAPRDVLVMTPQIERYAPLLSSVFNDSAAIGIDLPWRLTDRSQQSSPGLSMAMFTLLELAATRLTATGLERLLANPALQGQQGLTAEDAVLMTQTLQRSGFRWGLDSRERGSDEVHSLRWCLDRWLLGLVLPVEPGLAPAGAAPFQQGLDPDRLVRWWSLLDRLARMLDRLRQPRPCHGWVQMLQSLLEELFADGGAWADELQSWAAALEEWRLRAEDCPLDLDAAVALEVLQEALSVDSGRFGHRSGALTISALEPMRAIPHKVIVLMGLDSAEFPRPSRRPGFHLLEQQRSLGDPRSSDQDRYVLLEALMSARRHLLISWCGRLERTGEPQPPAAPVEQWLAVLQEQLHRASASTEGLVITPATNPLSPENFRPEAPLSCDRRQLEARRCLDRAPASAQDSLGLAWSSLWREPLARDGDVPTSVSALDPEALLTWMQQPQKAWLQARGLRPGEGIEAVEDLEALELDGLQRYLLLNHELEEQFILGSAPDWTELLAGQGVLPAGAGAALEQEDLQQRWQALQRQLASLGPCRREVPVLAGLPRPLLFAGDTQVVVQPGMLTAAAVMRGWLQHLLLCAEGLAPAGGSAVVARSTRVAGAEVHLRWAALPEAEAMDRLHQLQDLAQQGLVRCWPVPPKSGWQMVAKEQRKPGSGELGFRATWQEEGTTPVMQLCFGTEISAEQLMEQDGFQEACQLLYGPLLAQLR